MNPSDLILSKVTIVLLTLMVAVAFCAGEASGYKHGQLNAKKGIWSYHFVTNTVQTVSFE